MKLLWPWVFALVEASLRQKFQWSCNHLMWLVVSVNCQSYRKSGLTVTTLHAITPQQDPGGWRGWRRRWSNFFVFQTCHGIEHYKHVKSRVVSQDHCIFSPHHSRVHLCMWMCVCLPVKNALRCVRVYSIHVRCKCAGTQSPPRGGCAASVIVKVQIELRSRIWLGEMARHGMRLSTPLSPFFVFLPSLSLCLKISKLSRHSEPWKCNALSLSGTFSLSCVYVLIGLSLCFLHLFGYNLSQNICGGPVCLRIECYYILWTMRRKMVQ